MGKREFDMHWHVTKVFAHAVMAMGIGMAAMMPNDVMAQQLTLQIKSGNLNQALQQVIQKAISSWYIILMLLQVFSVIHIPFRTQI